MWKGDWLPKAHLTRKNFSTNEDTDSSVSEPEESFRGGGIKLTPIEPMRKWRLEFKGNLRSLVSSKIIMNQKVY